MRAKKVVLVTRGIAQVSGRPSLCLPVVLELAAHFSTGRENAGMAFAVMPVARAIQGTRVIAPVLMNLC
jgi:hypothetical protein